MLGVGAGLAGADVLGAGDEGACEAVLADAGGGVVPGGVAGAVVLGANAGSDVLWYEDGWDVLW